MPEMGTAWTRKGCRTRYWMEDLLDGGVDQGFNGRVQQERTPNDYWGSLFGGEKQKNGGEN